MKRFVLAMALPCSVLASDSPDIPVSRPFADYEKMVSNSPFTLATPVAKPAEVNPFQNYYVTGLSKLEGKDCVFLSTRDGQNRYTLFAGEQGPDGLIIDRVEWSEEMGRSKVHLRRGTGAGVAGEAGVVEFDQAQIQRPVAAAPAPMPNAPGQPNRPTLPPGFRNRTPDGQTPGVGPSEQRRRVRIINNPTKP